MQSKRKTLMTGFLVFALGAILALGLFLDGFAKGSAQTQNTITTDPSVTVVLKAQNGSGEDGTATMLQHGNTLIVSVSVARGTMVSQPAHIHSGQCAKIGGVVYPLSNVVSGKSTTTLKNVSLASVEPGDFAINIHKSAEDIGTYVSCGETPRI